MCKERMYKAKNIAILYNVLKKKFKIFLQDMHDFHDIFCE